MTVRGLVTIVVASAVASLGLLACGAGSGGGVGGGVRRGALAPAQQQQFATLIAEADAAWQKRGEQAQLELAIQKWEQAVALKDDDAATYVKLARATYMLADSYYGADPATKPQMMKTHEKGIEYGQRGIAAVSPEFERKMATGVALESAVKAV